MPKVTGIFDIFKNLDQIRIEDIDRWLKPTSQLAFLENYFGNRIYYTQVAPVTLEEMKIDLAILRECLKRNQEFFAENGKKIIIPEAFISRLPNLSSLILAYIDAYPVKGIVTVILTSDFKDEILGSIVAPTFKGQGSSVDLLVEGKSYQIKQGNVNIIPCHSKRCHINFKSKDAQILGKEEITVEAYGGKLGIVTDCRRLS